MEKYKPNSNTPPSKSSKLIIAILAITMSASGCMDNSTENNTPLGDTPSAQTPNVDTILNDDIIKQTELRNGVAEIVKNKCGKNNINDCIAVLSKENNALGMLARDFIDLQANEAIRGRERSISFIEYISIIIISGGDIYNGKSFLSSISPDCVNIYNKKIKPYLKGRKYGKLGGVNTVLILNLLLSEVSKPPNDRVLSTSR